MGGFRALSPSIRCYIHAPLMQTAYSCFSSTRFLLGILRVSVINQYGPQFNNGEYSLFPQALRFYNRRRSSYDLFGKGKLGDEEYRKAWAKEAYSWSDSDEDEDGKKDDANVEEEVRKMKEKAEEEAKLIDADDSDELRSVWSGSDEEKTLWTGSEEDSDDDIPPQPRPNERSDEYIDKLFEFEDKPKYRTIAELLKGEKEEEKISPGKQARKIAVENALKKLKKGPDGRYTNVWEVMSDIDILIGAFENIVSGPEYAELRDGGPKKLNIEFFKDIQAKMRDPNYQFSPEMRLKPKSKLVPRKKWEKAQAKKRKFNER
ncbi:uncharacterized protein LOC18434167 [Amborella trichopoda]|uniref:uncharacterized protein LOC18434167 n=1 Tax=Amborella trichopoda TaxID=13333 RepID=UPI0005D3B6D3|nr:uncharacterized protein LOC18434167 [Amborella trichopoda]|eukprot:XP_006844308.2 uncharacterized protein LOC18434167 [Amborella trichopoda]